jgi:hypothetical protein
MFRFFIFLFFISKTFGQTLNFKNFSEIYVNKPNSEHKYLLKKGFRQDNDTTISGINYFYFSNIQSNEKVEVAYYDGLEGDSKFTVNYYLPSKQAYTNFLASVKKSKLKYSKRNQRFQYASSSYSGEWLSANGLVDNAGKKYYAIVYVDYVGREIMAPIIPLDMPIKDTLGK